MELLLALGVIGTGIIILAACHLERREIDVTLSELDALADRLDRAGASGAGRVARYVQRLVPDGTLGRPAPTLRDAILVLTELVESGELEPAQANRLEQALSICTLEDIYWATLRITESVSEQARARTRRWSDARKQLPKPTATKHDSTRRADLPRAVVG